MGDSWQGVGPETRAPRVVTGSSGALAGHPAAPPKWPEVEPLLAAMRGNDRAGFRTALDRFTAAVKPIAEAAPTTATLFLYDLLRTLLETAALAGAPTSEPNRLDLLGRLGAVRDSGALLRAFVDEIDRLSARVLFGRPVRRPVALRARRFIDEHAVEKISLARVARELGVTRTYLSALFRRECGVTLTEYIHQVRIERAETLLRSGGLSIAEVASRSGYGSYRHFHRSFLKLHRVSPRLFLKNLQPSTRGPAPTPVSAAPGLPDPTPDRSL